MNLKSKKKRKHKTHTPLYLTTLCVFEGSEEISVVMYVVVPLVLTILALILMACLAQHGM